MALIRRVLSVAGLVLVCAAGNAQLTYERGIDWNLPESVRIRFEKNQTLARYDLSDAVNPFYLRGDFDGDGKQDYAILVVNKITKRRLIAIVRTGSKDVDIIGGEGEKLLVGAGADAYPLDDFNWIDAWHVEGKPRPALKKGAASKMAGEGIMVEKTESGSALIYWNGRTYQWKQLGD